MVSALSVNVIQGAFDGALGTGTSIYLGTESAAGFDWFGTIREVHVWQKQLSHAQLKAITAQ